MPEKITLKNICKSFYGVPVLHDINLQFQTGEIHVICGENGAGKSTLMKILSGLYSPESGHVAINGNEIMMNSISDATRKGISIVLQEINLCPTISIAENLFLNREPGNFFINKTKLFKMTSQFLELVGLNKNPNTLISSLSNAEMQLVQIAQGLSAGAKFLILDEPTSSLTIKESERLFVLLNKLKQEGVGIIYIDHRIEDFMEIGDRLTILRDGQLVKTTQMSEITRDEIIEAMVGHKVNESRIKVLDKNAEIILDVMNFSNKKLNNISFQVRAGEVLGLGGLVGAGRSEILRAIFGVDLLDKSSRILVRGQEIKTMTPRKAIRLGIGYVPEDRRLQSLILFRDIGFNLTLAFLDLINTGWRVAKKKDAEATARQIENLKIKVLNRSEAVSNLSGGNQQKVVLGRWVLNEDLSLLLLDEPTRGVDIGVKSEIYRLIDNLTKKGVAILLVTSELPELLLLSDRIAVIRDGSLIEVIEEKDYSQERVLGSAV